jgi:hypothetical protein
VSTYLGGHLSQPLHTHRNSPDQALTEVLPPDEREHHYTGWYDFPTPLGNDFKTEFYGSGYRNNGNYYGAFYRLALRRLSTSPLSR